MAVNYNDGMATPRGADAFLKSPDAVIGDGDTMVLGDVPATVFEGEAELAVIIGKRGRNVSAGRRDEPRLRLHQLHRRLRPRLMPVAGFYSMKSRATYAPIGPFIVTKDEVPDPYHLQVQALEQRRARCRTTAPPTCS